MATKAYLLVETAADKTRGAVNALREMDHVVKSVDVVTGPYENIAVLEASDMHEIGDFVTEKVHTTPGVIRTVTCVIVGE